MWIFVNSCSGDYCVFTNEKDLDTFVKEYKRYLIDVGEDEYITEGEEYYIIYTEYVNPSFTDWITTNE